MHARIIKQKEGRRSIVADFGSGGVVATGGCAAVVGDTVEIVAARGRESKGGDTERVSVKDKQRRQRSERDGERSVYVACGCV